jgi:hypothetical protein
MLADVSLSGLLDAVAFHRRGMFSTAVEPAAIDRLRDYAVALSTAERFVLSDGASAIVCDLARDSRGVVSSNGRVLLPSDRTWIEMVDDAGGQLGVLIDMLDQERGRGVLVRPLSKDRAVFPLLTPFTVRRRETGMSFECWPAGPKTAEVCRQLPAGFEQVAERFGAFMDPGSAASQQDRLGRCAVAALALINTPRVSEAVTQDLSKLNRARTKLGRPELLTYSTVVIRPGLASTRPPATGETGDAGRALHKVRAHFRLRLGKVEIVRSHWRGDEANGVRLHDYRVEA